MRILVVEDDAVLAMVCALALEDAGHTVLGPVHDTESFARIAGLAGTDLALVDINLAGGDEGLQLARELQAQHIPTLFISGQLGAARENSHLALGLLRKPYETEDLINSIAYLQSTRFSGTGLAAPKPATLETFGSDENI